MLIGVISIDSEMPFNLASFMKFTSKIGVSLGAMTGRTQLFAS
jgi:hypothetical protein